jgi:hypothetical protein
MLESISYQPNPCETPAWVDSKSSVPKLPQIRHYLDLGSRQFAQKFAQVVNGKTQRLCYALDHQDEDPVFQYADASGPSSPLLSSLRLSILSIKPTYFDPDFVSF